MAYTHRKETGLLPKGRMSVNAIGPEYASYQEVVA